MNQLREKFQSSAVYVRVMPFVVFLALTFTPALLKMIGYSLPKEFDYWLYVVKTLVGAWMIWEMRPFVAEMRWNVSWEAVVVGIAVVVMWIGIDAWYPHVSADDTVWNPHAQFAGNPALAWMFLVVRVLGMSLVVPVLEEVFWRSFLYRWCVNTDFLKMPLNQFHPTSFILVSTAFGFEHSQWLAGILCGFAYQGLVLRKNRIGDAITAHALTNFLLGVWVIWKQDWKFF